MKILLKINKKQEFLAKKWIFCPSEGFPPPSARNGSDIDQLDPLPERGQISSARNGRDIEQQAQKIKTALPVTGAISTNFEFSSARNGSDIDQPQKNAFSRLPVAGPISTNGDQNPGFWPKTAPGAGDPPLPVTVPISTNSTPLKTPSHARRGSDIDQQRKKAKFSHARNGSDIDQR